MFSVRYVTDEAFADFHKVDGLRGVFIASQLRPDYGPNGLDPDDLITLITFDKGNTWRPVKPPLVDYEGQSISCEQVNENF